MTTLSINGKQYSIDLPADTPLLWVLRDEVGLTGTKLGLFPATTPSTRSREPVIT